MTDNTFSAFTPEIIQKRLRPAINAALDGLLPQLQLKLGNATFSETSVVFKLEVTIAGGVNLKDARLIAAAKQVAAWDGLAKYLTEPLTIAGKSLTIWGYDSRSRKLPYIAFEAATGKRFKFDAETLKRAAVVKESAS